MDMKPLFVFISIVFWICGAHATPLDKSLSPGQNFNLEPFRLQTLDADLQFKQVDPIGTYQDAHFLTDQTSGAIRFRIPAGAGHTQNSEFPRVELRQKHSWIMDADNKQARALNVVLQISEGPKTGEIIFAQIHGEKTGGSEALKMRWRHGTILMGVKKQFGDKEDQIQLLNGLSLGDVIECKILLTGDILTVSVSSGTRKASQQFSYDAASWQNIPLYYKTGVYLQDKTQDGSFGTMVIQQLSVIE